MQFRAKISIGRFLRVDFPFSIFPFFFLFREYFARSRETATYDERASAVSEQYIRAILRH